MAPVRSAQTGASRRVVPSGSHHQQVPSSSKRSCCQQSARSESMSVVPLRWCPNTTARPFEATEPSTGAWESTRHPKVDQLPHMSWSMYHSTLCVRGATTGRAIEVPSTSTHATTSWFACSNSSHATCGAPLWSCITSRCSEAYACPPSRWMLAWNPAADSSVAEARPRRAQSTLLTRPENLPRVLSALTSSSGGVRCARRLYLRRHPAPRMRQRSDPVRFGEALPCRWCASEMDGSARVGCRSGRRAAG